LSFPSGNRSFFSFPRRTSSGAATATCSATSGYTIKLGKSMGNARFFAYHIRIRLTAGGLLISRDFWVALSRQRLFPQEFVAYAAERHPFPFLFGFFISGLVRRDGLKPTHGVRSVVAPLH